MMDQDSSQPAYRYRSADLRSRQHHRTIADRRSLIEWDMQVEYFPPILGLAIDFMAVLSQKSKMIRWKTGKVASLAVAIRFNLWEPTATSDNLEARPCLELGGRLV